MSGSVAVDDASKKDSPDLHNRDVERALKDYCHFPHAQGFAVMLSGQWGSGKTHFIKGLLEGLVPPGKDPKKHKPLYVSLYGVKDPGEIADQLFPQLHPVLAHKATRLFGAVLRSAAKSTFKFDLGHGAQASGFLPEFDATSMLGGAEGRIVIFDDFERSEMSPVALLGYINPLVEHDDCKVIILSDEGKVAKPEEYRKRKEKTVGRTFELKADAGAAFGAFMEAIDDRGTRDFLASSKEVLLRIFADSGRNNLRLLKQFLWDFERLWKILTREQREHQEATRELVSLLCACTIELRSGGLTEETFRLNDILHQVKLHDDKPDDAARDAQKVFERYPTVPFDSNLLERETIVDLILRSKLPAEHIQGQLRRHPYFAKVEEMPSWRALWLSQEASSKDHDAILRRFEQDFDARAFRDEKEILHVIGLSLWLSRLGLPGWEDATLVGKVERYITDVYGSGEAKPEEVAVSTVDLGIGGAYGLGFMNSDDARFEELARYQQQQRAAWRRRAYPSIGAQLLRLMTEDSETFLRDVCFTNGGRARFAHLGVLKEIPANQFAQVLVNAPYGDRKNVAIAISLRYERLVGEPELVAELPWLREVQRHLHERAKALPPIARDHLTRLVRLYVDKTLTQADALLHDERRPDAPPGTTA